MNENKDTDSKESGEYEDDFEKDLEWLINEKESDAGIIEMAYEKNESVNQELKENEAELEHPQQLSDSDKSSKDEVSPRRNDFISVPSIQAVDPISDSDSENSSQESKHESQKDLEEEEEDEEVRRYIMDKIIQANKLLQNQEPVNDRRERKLKFKDTLVDLEVPPLEDNDTYKSYFENESMSGKLSQLCISSELTQENILLSLSDGNFEENKDKKILVERDGKFELLNLQDIESQGGLPSISNTNSTENEPQPLPLTSPSSGVSGVSKEELAAKIHATQSSTLEPLAYVPQPPLNPKIRPSSAANSDHNKGNGKSHSWTQATNISSVTSTYCLSPRQKELRKQQEQKREKLKREEEQRKIEEEKEKKKENDIVFKAWLQKKREQVLEKRRIQRAKQIENMNNRERAATDLPVVARDEMAAEEQIRDPQAAFRLWLKKKHEEQMKERKTEELRKQEECLFFLKGAEGREKAFKQWLRRKRIEKIAEQQAIKERTRQLRLEARRSKQLHSQLYSLSEARTFRFTDHYN